MQTHRSYFWQSFHLHHGYAETRIVCHSSEMMTIPQLMQLAYSYAVLLSSAFASVAPGKSVFYECFDIAANFLPL